MDTAALLHNRHLLGPSPFLRGLLWWCFGVSYCIAAWHVYTVMPMLGLGLLGLAPFVNLFCFFSGVTCLRRAWMRRRTWRQAARLGLRPAWGAGRAAYFLVDEDKGVCVINGKAADFADIETLVCRTTPMAYRLQVFLRGPRPLPKRPALPVEIGFASETELHRAAHKLYTAVTTHKSRALPQHLSLYLEDMDGNRTPLPFS